MHTTGDSGRPHPGAVRVRSTLDRLATGLAGFNLESLLACESDLAAALVELSVAVEREDFDRRATIRELMAARAAVTRCRRLGATLGDLSRIAQTARGGAPAYSRLGETHTTMAMHSLEAKV
jgi:hypothetical protein